MSVTEPVKKYNVLASTTKTKKNMNVIKNIKSWCKLIIPSITGVAGSWKEYCQAMLESVCKKNIKWEYCEKIEKRIVSIRANRVQEKIKQPNSKFNDSVLMFFSNWIVWLALEIIGFEPITICLQCKNSTIEIYPFFKLTSKMILFQQQFPLQLLCYNLLKI